MGEELGIPGHAGKSEWSRMLQEWLRDCGFSYEAEGEATRIRLGEGVLLEVAEQPGGEGYELVASAALASTGRELVESGLPGSLARALEALGRAAGDRELVYELDTSLPGYPMLYVRAGFEDPWELAEGLVSALKPLCRGGEGGEQA